MKKALFFAGLAAATLSFVACNKEATVNSLDATPMEVILSTAETRTTTDGIHTSWAEGDKINVIHAEAGTTDYKNDTPYLDGKTNPFVLKDPEAGTFTGKLLGGDLETGKSYDWYFFYPYSSYIESPVNTSSSGGYAYIGGRSDQSQTQSGNNSRTHLAGGTSSACFPLYGVKKDVPADEQPVATMKHIASAVAVTVKNETDNPIVVSQVEFTAPEKIVGQFYISFDKESLSFEDYKYTSQTASLTVKEGAEIAKDATAAFYIGIKPFTAKAGDKLTVKITTAAGEAVEKEVTLPADVEFKSGLIKTLNVGFDKGEEVQTLSLAEVKELEKGADVHTQEVLVVAKYARGIMLAQDGVYLLAYKGSEVDAKVGDIVKVSGKMGAYSNTSLGKDYPQIASPEVTVISSGNPVVLPEPKVLSTLDGYDQTYPELIQYTGTLSVSGSYYNVTVPGSTNVGSIQYPLNADEVKALDKKLVTVTGFFVGMSGSKYYVNTMLTSIKECEANAFDVAEREIYVTATTTSAQIRITGNVDWTVHPEDGILSADPLSGTGEGTVTVTFAANTDSEAGVEYVVHLRTEATGVEDEIEVIIMQDPAAPAPTVAEVLSGGAGTYDMDDLLVYAVSGKNAIVGDYTGKMLLYMDSHGLSVGDLFSVSGATVTEYNGVLEITNGTFTKKSEGIEVEHDTPSSLDDATVAASVYDIFSAAGFHSAVYVSITGNQSGRYIENDNAKLYLNQANNETDRQKVVATGYVYSYSTKHSNYNFHLVSIEVVEDEKTLDVSASSLVWEADDVDAKTITVTTTNPATDGFTVSPATLEFFEYSVSGNVITVNPKGTVTANQTETLTLTHTGDATLTKTVTLIRKAAGEGSSVVYTLTPAEGSNNAYANNCDIVIDGITWNLTGNSTFQPWRIGGKSLTEVDRALYSKTPMPYDIEKIDIKHGAASNITVNSMTVIVATDADFAQVVSTLTPAFAAESKVTVNRPAGASWSNCYYKIVYNVTVSGSSNKFLEFAGAEFTGK